MKHRREAAPDDYVIVGAGSAGCVLDRTARSAFMRTSTPERWQRNGARQY
jgi:hypothetical protein